MQLRTLTLSLSLLLTAACNTMPDTPLNFAEVVKKMEGPKIDSMQDVQLKEAKKNMDAGDFTKASSVYAQLVSKYPDNMTYQLGLANSLRLSSDLEKARKAYNIVIDGSKKDSKEKLDAIEGKGLCYLQEGDFEEAVKSFSTVLKQDATRWRTINALGIAFALTGRPKEAMEYYNAALQLSGNNPIVLNNMGLSMAFNGKLAEAVTPLEKASSLMKKEEPERERVDLNLALVYGLNGRTSDAERVSKSYLSQAGLYNNLGVYALLANNKPLAQSYLKKALSSSPEHYQKAWDNLQKVGG